jgi:transcription antitermination factor NusG
MPVLPLEPFLYPDHLFEIPPEPENSTLQWWVLHTRPRAEKSLARRLLKARHPFFLPLLTRQGRRHPGARKLISHIPLFPSYLFLFGDSESRVASLTTNMVVQAIPVDDQARLFHDLTNIHRLMVNDAPITPEDRLLPGTLVEVTEGPFAGLTGKILRRGSSWHLFVEVNFLKCGVTLEIERWMVQPLDSPRRALAGGL